MREQPDAEPRLCHWPSWPVHFGLDLDLGDDDPCHYLAGRRMRVRGFACGRVAGAAYQELLDAGFRRSGSIYYQPACPGCRACVPLRVPVDGFVPGRSLRRVRRRNLDLAVAVGRPSPDDEKHALYVRYLEGRHDGTMSREREAFTAFLYDSSTDTVEITFRDPGGRLLCVGLCDLTPRAVSSVYCYSEPAEPRRSLGTFSSLVEIDFARTTGRRYYYLGYWVADCPRMAYKERFRPCEVLGPDGVWRPLAAAGP